MRVIGIVGSPRQGGNTATLVERILAGAAEAGAETKIYSLNELHIRGCQACGYCKTHDGRCRQEDDMTPIYADLLASDGIVVGTPIYMGYLSAQTMLFVNRLYAFFIPGQPNPVPPGKKAALVFSCGNSDETAYRKVLESFGETLSHLFGVAVKGIVGSGGNGAPGAVKEKQDVLDTAFALGKSLVG
ncbi:MAG: flavodoxin family protein [Thermacetogeniaceae bacterium]